MAQLNFNAAQVQPQQAFEPVPNNWYNVTIDESEVKPTNDGSGAYLSLRLNIMDGNYANRKLYCRLNIQNQNEKTVEIAYQQLSAICHATNTIQVNDSTELHGKPFQVKVVVKPPQNGYDASNEFKGFKACENGGGNAAAGAGGTTPAWAGNNQQQAGNGQAAAPAGDQQPGAQQGVAQNTAEAAAQPANQNTQQSWNQNNNQQQTGNNQATVETTPDQNNAGGNKSAPWMK